MTREQAQALVTLLAAAFPFPRPPVATVALYVDRLQRLDRPDVARTAVDRLIDSGERFPTIAQLRDEYHATLRANAAELAARRGLDEPPADPGNAARARALLEQLNALTRDVA